MPYALPKRQVTFQIDPQDWDALVRLGRRAGRAPNGEAKAIVLDVLRDDAAAHNESEKRNAVA